MFRQNDHSKRLDPVVVREFVGPLRGFPVLQRVPRWPVLAPLRFRPLLFRLLRSFPILLSSLRPPQRGHRDRGRGRGHGTRDRSVRRNARTSLELRVRGPPSNLEWEIAAGLVIVSRRRSTIVPSLNEPRQSFQSSRPRLAILLRLKRCPATLGNVVARGGLDPRAELALETLQLRLRTDHDRIATVPERDRSRRIGQRLATGVTLLSSLLLRPRHVAPCDAPVLAFRHRVQLPEALETARRQHPRIRAESDRSEAAPRFRPRDAQQSRLVDAAHRGRRRRGAVRMIAVVRRPASRMGGASRGTRMVRGGGEEGGRVRFSIGEAQRSGGQGVEGSGCGGILGDGYRHHGGCSRALDGGRRDPPRRRRRRRWRRRRRGRRGRCRRLEGVLDHDLHPVAGGRVARRHVHRVVRGAGGCGVVL